MARGIDQLSESLLWQRDFLADREPAYARLLELLEKVLRGELGVQLARTWAQREFNSRYERPLLLLAALRGDALIEGESHPLYAALARSPAQAGAVTREALAAACAPERTRFWDALATRSMQTNETTRAVTWLWPAHLLARAGERRALTLVDLGASAGLNLIADGLPPLWQDQHGAPIPVAPRPPVRMRLGLDAAPLDVRDDDAAGWLRACVWPSDAERLARLDQAIARFRACAAGEDAPQLERCDLVDAPARLATLPEDGVLLCYQSIVADYLRAEDRARYERGMRELLQRRAPRSALWCELEVVDPSAAERSAAITARFADAGGALRELVLCRTHPHPRRLFCDAAAVQALLEAFG